MTLLVFLGLSKSLQGENLIKYLYSNKSTGTKTGTIKRVLLLSYAGTRSWQACFCRSVLGHFTRQATLTDDSFPGLMASLYRKSVPYL